MRHNLTTYIQGLKRHLRSHQNQFVRSVSFSGGAYEDECETEEVDMDALEEEIDHFTRDFLQPM